MSTCASSAEDCQEVVRLRHELRQYVAAGELLLDLPERGSDAVEVGRALEGVRHVFRALSDLASPSGTHDEEGWTFDAAQLVGECVSALGLTDDPRLDLVTASPTVAFGHPVLLRRAVTNALDNAVRAAGRGGHLRVLVERLPGSALVEICDDGAGFGQIPAVTGQGMSIIDSALRASHGRLEISSGPGPGTTVRLLIPTARKDGRTA